MLREFLKRCGSITQIDSFEFCFDFTDRSLCEAKLKAKNGDSEFLGLVDPAIVGELIAHRAWPLEITFMQSPQPMASNASYC